MFDDIAHRHNKRFFPYTSASLLSVFPYFPRMKHSIGSVRLFAAPAECNYCELILKIRGTPKT